MNTSSISDLRIDSPGGRLFARRWDREGASDRDLAPIVLFHDSLGCVELWRDFPELLAAATQRTVIAYDRLGFGKSDSHPGNLALDFIRDEAATSFAAVRKALRLDRFVAFGHSVGGGMAVECAALHADACTALVTESAQAFVEERTLQGIREARRNFSAGDRRERLKRLHGDKADWVLGAWIETWLDPAFAAWRLDAGGHRLDLPVLAIHGDQDEFGSPEHPRRIAALAGEGSWVLLLQECGHVPHRQRPEAVLEAAANWLR